MIHRRLDAPPIDCLGNRAAYSRVGQLRTAQVESEVSPVRDRPALHRNAGDAVQTGDIVCYELVKDGVDVGNDLPDHFFEVRRPAKIAPVRDEGQRASVVPSLEHERSAGERAFVEARLAQVPGLREQMRGHRRIRGAADCQNS